MESRTRMSRIAYGGACIFAGLAVLILIMRPATRTTPAALPDYEATRS